MKFKYFLLTLVFGLWAFGSYAAEAPSRSRPGFISGAVMSKQSSLYYSKNNTMLRECGKEYKDCEQTPNCKECQDKTPPCGSQGNPCKPGPNPPPPPPPPEPECDIIPSLGVCLDDARRACLSIWADGHQAEFNDATQECCVPVVAHNWGGIIKKNGQDVWSCIPMGTTIKCNSKLFEEISSMRRSSQWVIPTMIGVGALGGLGIGALVDNANNKKEREKEDARKKAEKTQAEALAAQVAAAKTSILNQQTSYNQQLSAEVICLTDDDKPGVMDEQGFCVAGVSVEDIKKALTAEIEKAQTNIKKCTQKLFAETVSTRVGTACKRGRIRITANGTDTTYSTFCLNNGVKNQVDLFCGYERVYATSGEGTATKITQYANCSGNADMERNCAKEASKPSFFSEGACYYRDEITRTNKTLKKTYTNNKHPDHKLPAEYANEEDTTASFDNHAYKILKNFALTNSKTGAPFYNDPIIGVINNLDMSEYWNTVDEKYKPTDSPSAETIITNTAPARVFRMTSGTFGDIFTEGGTGLNASNFTNNDSCKIVAGNPAFNTAERLAAWQAYLEAMDAVPDALKDLQAKVKATAHVAEELALDLSSLDAIKFPARSAEKQEKKKFFQTGKGRGLLIGTGVGTLGGLAYYFAEGASVFCNVGGLEQVKLDKTYSIPSLREYIVKHGFLK